MPQTAEAAEKVETVEPVARPQAPEPRKKDEPEVPPPYRVLLHNDDVNLFEQVVRVLHRLTPLNLEEAFERTTEAHTRGRSVLLSTHKERAELYVEQLASAGLTVTMEQDA